jgi:hypothetical protein
LCILPAIILAQSNYPGADIFSYSCLTSSIQFTIQGEVVIGASFAEVSGPLSLAVYTQQNQLIKRGMNGVSLWALKSNELQIHRDSDPEGTKLVLPSLICGADLLTYRGVFSGKALAFVNMYGSGQGIAFAQIGPDGQVTAFASVSGPGQAFAYAEVTSQTGLAYHIVQPGENLFRIALRYGTTVSILAALNGISNPSLIYIGQIIYLPD